MHSTIKIISGGQTGVDRAALDVALEHGFSIGGWCPKGRLAEDGLIPEKYPLVETRSKELHVRTQRNVESSTATLVLTRGAPTGGTRFTVEVAESMRRPHLVVSLSDPNVDPVQTILQWIDQVKPRVLNVAGPRESNCPGIAAEASEVLRVVFRKISANAEARVSHVHQHASLPAY